MLAADACAIGLGAVALGLLIVGPYREAFAGTPVTVRWTHALFASFAVLAIRHAAAPSPSIRHTTMDAWRRLRRRPALVDAFAAFWLTRPAVLAVGLLAVATFGVAPAATEQTVSRDPIRALPARWDAQWYAGIAADGYDWQGRYDRQQNLAFFPAYPMAMRVAGVLAGAFRAGLPEERMLARLAWCGVAIAWVAFFWACWYLSRIARTFMEGPEAGGAVLLLAAYPFAVFYSAPYTEAVFLLSAAGAWHHFRRDEHGRAFAWGLLAGLVRPNGCFLSVPLGLLAVGVADAGESVSRPISWRRLFVASAPGLGMLAFTVYLYQLTNVWFAWSRLHAAWGRVLGADSLIGWIDAPASAGVAAFVAARPYDALNAGGLLFAVGGLVLVRRRLGTAWAAFVLVNVLAPLAVGGLLSMGRLTSTLFPLFLALGARLSPRGTAAVATVFAILQGLLAALFFTWRDVY